MSVQGRKAACINIMASKNKRRVVPHAEDVSLETTVPTDLSFSPDEVSELQTTDDDRTRCGRSADRLIQVSCHLAEVSATFT